jgi:hypothetical protein
VGIVNAVLVTSKIAPRWVVDSGSVATWGRLEDTIAVGNVDDADLVDAIGAEYLAVRSQPMVSHVYQVADVSGQVAGVDYREGDTIADPDLRVIDIAFAASPEGRLVGTPALATKLEERFRRNAARIERLIAEGGGAAPVSQSAALTGSGIDAGKLEARKLTSWSWTTQDDLSNLLTADPADPETWQGYPIDEPMRLCELVLECSHVDGDNVAVATGETRFRLLIDGVAPTSDPSLGSIPIDVFVDDNEGRASTPIFGGSIVAKGQVVSVQRVGNGGHVNGSVTIHASQVI